MKLFFTFFFGFIIAVVFISSAHCQTTVGGSNAGIGVTISGGAGGGSPTGSAGGALAGTYPNPTIANVTTTGCVAYELTSGVLTCTASLTFFPSGGSQGLNILDYAAHFTATGVLTNVTIDNDSFRCKEGDELAQRGSCEFWSFRIANNARFWDLTDAGISFGDLAGGGAGDRVGLYRFTSDGATAGKVHIAASDGGTHMGVKGNLGEFLGGLDIGVGQGFSGHQLFAGVTSGGSGFAANDIAGTAILYLLPVTNGTANQILSDSGTAACPTLASGAPALCHQLVWVTPSGGGGSPSAPDLSLQANDGAGGFAGTAYASNASGFINVKLIDDPTGSLTLALSGTAGNVDNGAHCYAMTWGFVSGGKAMTYPMGYDSVTVTDKTTSGQVLVSAIPVSADARVGAKYLFRTKAGASCDDENFYLLDTIIPADTTYTDNKADSSLTAQWGNFDWANTTGQIKVTTTGYSADTSILSLADEGVILNNSVWMATPTTSSSITNGGGILGSLTMMRNNHTALITGLATGGNCSSSASPAVCAAASAGSVAIPTGVTSVALTVNTTAVTANSRILLTADDSLTIPATTCNSTLATLVGGMAVTARTPGTSFEVTYNGPIATNPLCVSYVIVN